MIGRCLRIFMVFVLVVVFGEGEVESKTGATVIQA
jgi:hypothetical protein